MTAFINELITGKYFSTVGDTTSANHLNRNRRIVQFFLFGVAIDLLLIMAEMAAGISPLEDIFRNPMLYGYVFMVTVAAFSFFGAMIGSREDHLEKLALRDPLTGLFNSRYLWTRMDEQWATGKREKSDSSLILFDLDFFKRVNDRYGHPVGDELLKHVGKILQHAARRSDVAARIGGEEFVFFLPNTSSTAAAAIAERIRDTISRTTLITDKNHQVTITISAGVASIDDYNANIPRTLYAKADKALYLAKQQGRNRVVISKESKKEISKKITTMV
ncbi:diguanylate cyclase (GGDEF) domain-containing protein [Desulfocapsa sulfexigens DSM 10523]|uniref:diguanylate cyclase n=1 Tax=Desulfocapsa sulfexigens (strain DSM 10523 / SB164P1) TaxID=1167006 RepID=M1PDA2_DESSD|nr:GGDEF domain-containing protein [Desulfocapsa sulfexigens]AGF79577.1 diguanylate cyclase (GGDEF) domain-containing protein [Desulfocapsa sulfexigens DSM 10523]